MYQHQFDQWHFSNQIRKPWDRMRGMRTRPRSRKISAGRRLRNEDILVAYSWRVLKFCIFQYFQKSGGNPRRYLLNFGGRWLWVPMNPSSPPPQSKLHGGALNRLTRSYLFFPTMVAVIPRLMTSTPHRRDGLSAVMWWKMILKLSVRFNRTGSPSVPRSAKRIREM